MVPFKPKLLGQWVRILSGHAFLSLCIIKVKEKGEKLGTNEMRHKKKRYFLEDSKIQIVEKIFVSNFQNHMQTWY